MDTVKTDPIHLDPTGDTVATWRALDDPATPINFTATLDGAAWSAEFLIEHCGKVVFRTPADITADGYVSVSVPAATAALIRSARRIDAHYQIKFTAPLPDFDMVWQGAVIVLEVAE